MTIGSIVVQPYGDADLEPMELGGSIFVKANKNLWRASEEFDLERSDFEEGSDAMGVWDGPKFLLTVSIIFSLSYSLLILCFSLGQVDASMMAGGIPSRYSGGMATKPRLKPKLCTSSFVAIY